MILNHIGVTEYTYSVTVITRRDPPVEAPSPWRF